jgi:hypothetical protein
MIATRHLKLMRDAALSLDLSAKLAENSYGHPNFTKISLSAPGGNENVRLHVWKEDDSNFHTHRWDMKSTIISGSYTTELFEEVDGQARSRSTSSIVLMGSKASMTSGQWVSPI